MKPFNLRIWCVVFISGFVLMSTVAHGAEKELLVLSHPFMPWQFYDETAKQVDGINIEIATRIFQKMGIPVKFKEMPWARAWYTIEKGKADAILSASRKEAREPYLQYPQEDMWVSEYVFFVRTDRKRSGIAGSYADIAKMGNTIGIVDGYSYHKSFWAAFPYKDRATAYDPDARNYHAKIQAAEEPAINFRKLAGGRIDVFINDKSIGLYMIKELGLQDRITHYETVLFSKGYPLAFAKKSAYPNLKNIADRYEQELIQLKEDGTYAEIVDKWIK